MRGVFHQRVTVLLNFMGGQLSFIITAVLMFLFWIGLSGDFNLILLLSGIFSCLFVAYISHDLLIAKGPIGLGTLRVVRFLKYLPWLLWQIVLSNFDLVYRTLHPSLPIEPEMVEFKTDLHTDKGITILANSITLTPGTVTVAANSRGEFLVHAIAAAPAESLRDGTMQRKVEEIEGRVDE